MSLTKKILIAAVVIAIFFSPLKTSAAYKLPKLMPNCDETIYVMSDGSKVPASQYNDSMGLPAKTELGDKPCGFDDFVQLLINAFRYALAILGGLVLFFYVWGGFGMITAAGNQEKIQENKNTIKGATIGMIIVLCAWIFVAFTVYVLTGNKEGNLFSGTGFARYWWGTGSCHTQYSEICTHDNLHEGCGGPPGTATDRYVRELQQTLNNRPGCDCGEVDGCFGDQTKQCVMAFQINNGVFEEGASFEGFIPLPQASAYGVVGPNFWAKVAEGGGCIDADIDLDFDVLPLDPNKKYCCIPPSNLSSSCVNTDSENCNGLIDIGYQRKDGSCGQYNECNVGCCVPGDVTDGCATSTSDTCSGSFVRDACNDINLCNFICCVAGPNQCKWQRATISAGQPCAEGGYTAQGPERESLNGICNDIEICSVGACAQQKSESWYRCADNVSEMKCLQVSNTQFFKGKSINHADNTIEGTTIHCDPSDTLYIP